MGASYGPGRGESEVIRGLQGTGWETVTNRELDSESDVVVKCIKF